MRQERKQNLSVDRVFPTRYLGREGPVTPDFLSCCTMLNTVVPYMFFGFLDNSHEPA